MEILDAIKNLRTKYDRGDKNYNSQLESDFLKMIEITFFSETYLCEFVPGITQDAIDRKYNEFIDAFSKINSADDEFVKRTHNAFNTYKLNIELLLNGKSQNNSRLLPKKQGCALIVFLLYKYELLNSNVVSPINCYDYMSSYFGEDKLYSKEPNDIILKQILFRIDDNPSFDLYFKYVFLVRAFEEYLNSQSITIENKSDVNTLDQNGSEEWTIRLNDERLWYLLIDNKEAHAHYRNHLRNHIQEITKCAITGFEFDLGMLYDIIYQGIEFDKDEKHHSNYLYDHTYENMFDDSISIASTKYYHKIIGNNRINRRDFLFYNLYYYIALLHSSKNKVDIKRFVNIDDFFEKVDMDMVPFFEPPVTQTKDFLSNAFTRGVFSISYLYCLICNSQTIGTFRNEDIAYLNNFLNTKECIGSGERFGVVISDAIIEFMVDNQQQSFNLSDINPKLFVELFEFKKDTNEEKKEMALDLLRECLYVYAFDAQFPKIRGISYKTADDEC